MLGEVVCENLVPFFEVGKARTHREKGIALSPLFSRSEQRH